ncbi:MAG: aminopeptidase P family protein [Promethearchaeota archaeon]|nr:MAG: aminopeptidase P family protein [Candidatus Lokiarchaeota archaeon]
MSVRKIQKIRDDGAFEEKGLEAIFLTKQENITYVLGFKIESDTFIMIPRDDVNEGITWIFVNALEYDQVKRTLAENKELHETVELKLIPGGKASYIPDEINNLDLKTVGFEEDFISVQKHEEWKEKFTIPNLIGASEIISNARMTKTQDEIERMKSAAKLGELGFKTIYDTIQEGMSEEELAAEAEYEMRKAGSEGTSFDTIVAAGEQSAYPHAKTSNHKIKDGDLIIVDIGARYRGYCSDMTRTFIFGKVEPLKAELVNLVNDGQEFGLEHAKAGILCKDLDKLVRKYFKKKKREWGNKFLHSLGHGVGVEIHENPYLSPISKEILQEGMVVTLEPGLYIQGLGGARTEDQVVIKKDGYTSLTGTQKFYY